MIFQPDNWVWIHFRKERFPSQRKTKLHPRGDNPYQVLKVINNNAYKMIFLENFQHILLSIFNVVDLSPFDVGDDFSNSRTNPFEESEDDKDHSDPNVPTGPAKKIQQVFILHVPTGPAKKIQQAFILHL